MKPAVKYAIQNWTGALEPAVKKGNVEIIEMVGDWAFGALFLFDSTSPEYIELKKFHNHVIEIVDKMIDAAIAEE